MEEIHEPVSEEQGNAAQDPQPDTASNAQPAENVSQDSEQATPVEETPQGPDQSEVAAPVQAQSAPMPPYPTSEEQQTAHDQRESEREATRREHAERTGGGEVREGELQAQRDEHNARTAPGGGQL